MALEPPSSVESDDNIFPFIRFRNVDGHDSFTVRMANILVLGSNEGTLRNAYLKKVYGMLTQIDDPIDDRVAKLPRHISVFKDFIRTKNNAEQTAILNDILSDDPATRQNGTMKLLKFYLLVTGSKSRITELQIKYLLTMNKITKNFVDDWLRGLGMDGREKTQLMDFIYTCMDWKQS